MKKRNVLHVIHSLDVGGAEKLVVDLAEETNNQQFNVMICCLDKIGKLGEDLLSKGVTVVSLGRRPGIDVKLICCLRKLYHDKEIDIVHAHQYTPFFYSSLARNFSRKPSVIFTEHGRFYPEKRSLKRFIFNPILSRFSSEIIAVSMSTKDAMVDYDNFARDKINVVYNGMKLKAIKTPNAHIHKQMNVGKEDFILVTAARLDPIKNHIMLIDVMRIITRSITKCKLIIIGDGSEYANLFAKINEYGLSEHVCLLGYRNNVLEIFRSSDVFLLSSLTEGTSVTLLEAMNAGLPGIVTNVGGNPEILKDKVTGFLVDSNDAEAMAEKILLLYHNRELATQLGKAGRERVEALFSFKMMLEKYEEMYIKYS